MRSLLILFIFVWADTLKSNYIVCFSLTDTVSTYQSIENKFIPSTKSDRKNSIIAGPHGYTYFINVICMGYKVDVRYSKGFFFFDSNQKELTIQVTRKKRKQIDTLQIHLTNPHNLLYFNLCFSKASVTTLDLYFGKSSEDFQIQMPIKTIEKTNFLDYTCALNHSCKPAFTETDYYKEKKEAEKERKKKENLALYEKRLEEINQELLEQCEDILKNTFPQEFISNYLRFKCIKPWYSGWDKTTITDTNHKSVYVTYTYKKPTSSLTFDIGIQASLNVPTLRGEAVMDYDTMFISNDLLNFIEPEKMIQLVNKKFPKTKFAKKADESIFYEFTYVNKRSLCTENEFHKLVNDPKNQQKYQGRYCYIFVTTEPREYETIETLYYFDALTGKLLKNISYLTGGKD